MNSTTPTMVELTASFPVQTIGLDLGDRNCVYEVLDASGAVTASGSVATTASALRKVFSQFRGGRVVLETGTHSPWVSEVLASIGLQVLVADARSVPVARGTRRKSDRIDTRNLARLGRSAPSLLKLVQHRPPTDRRKTSTIKLRDCLVRMRTAAINCVRGLLKSFDGTRVKMCNAEAFASRAREVLPDELRAVLEPMLDHIATLTKSVEVHDKEVSRLADEHPGARAVRQICGVGNLTALTFALTISDPKRFRRNQDVGAYLGLVPNRFQSGDSDPQLRITKTGNPMMRRLLVTAAHYILGPLNKVDSDLRRFGLALAGDGKNKLRKKKAVIAVARKTAVVMLALWRSGATYDPLRNAKRVPAPATPN